MNKKSLSTNILQISNEYQDSNESIIDAKYLKIECLGMGTYGCVYKTRVLNDGNNTDDYYAIKLFHGHIHPIFPLLETMIISYIDLYYDNTQSNTEVNMLYIIDGKSKGNVYDKSLSYTNMIYFVTNYIEKTPFSTFYTSCSILTIRKYIKSLLLSVDLLHRIGIVHRDIKPDNFIYNINTQEYLLIDYGIADIVDIKENRQLDSITMNKEQKENYSLIKQLIESNRLKNRPGTKGFMPLESIFDSELQNEKVDIWAVGIILLIFFSKNINVFNLNKYSKIQSKSAHDLLPFYCIFPKEEIDECAYMHRACLINENQERICDLNGLIKRNDIDDNGYDLLNKLLQLDYTKRISAKEALNHPFFQYT